MSKHKKRKQKATDATLRNVRASQHRDEKIGSKLAALHARVSELEKRVERLVKAIRSIASQL